MSTEVPGRRPRVLNVTVHPAPGTAAVDSDPFTAAVHVPVARVPITQLVEGPVPTPAAMPTAMDTAALPDDPAVLKQMIAELVRALRRSRRNEEEIQRRLDALLRRLYGPRPSPTNPDQPLLFPADAINDTPVSLPPAPLPADDPPSRRGQCKPHGRRRPPVRRDEPGSSARPGSERPPVEPSGLSGSSFEAAPWAGRAPGEPLGREPGVGRRALVAPPDARARSGSARHGSPVDAGPGREPGRRLRFGAARAS